MTFPEILKIPEIQLLFHDRGNADYDYTREVSHAQLLGERAVPQLLSVSTLSMFYQLVEC